MFQSTHPRGVRQLCYLYAALLVVVSIHAPARGATTRTQVHPKLDTSFNPRTREGCDGGLFGIKRLVLRFNPRTREGCDGGYREYIPAAVKVSIHAPARGATLRRHIELLGLRCFNPRTREGCDDMGISAAEYIRKFQSTHPRGVRHRLSVSM